MRIITHPQSFHKADTGPLVLGIGNFDGIHLGHQTLLKNVVREAERRNAHPAVLTFKTHPQHVLHPDHKKPLLMAAEHKLFFFKQLGITHCFWFDFTHEFSMMEPELFVRDLLVERLGVCEVSMGYNARFGHERKGDGALMRSLSEKYGFQFTEVTPVEAGGQFISSTALRDLVREGQFDQARHFLNRPFSVLGNVVKGDGRGRGLGFPTANIKTLSDVLPPAGVYPCRIRLLDLEICEEDSTEFVVRQTGPWLQGVLNHGSRPTFKDQTQTGMTTEVFILDFEGDLYGQKVEIEFYPKIRDERPFQNPDQLKQQIAKDVEQARLQLP